MTITQKYNANSATWSVTINEIAVIKHLTLTTPTLTDTATKRLLKRKTILQLHQYISHNSRATIGERDVLESIEEWRGNSAILNAIDVLNARLPRFLYFSTYGTLPGRVPVEALSNREDDEASQDESERLFLALLSLAETTINDLKNSGLSEELIARLESVSNRLSREIFEYWSQNHDLRVQFRYDEARPNDPEPFNQGHVFSLRVENTRHGVSVRFDERSAGFVWFFSFLVWFSQMENLFGDRLIILLDEPGLSLHGTAQGDLLSYIKAKLLPKYQVIYTTHSPFMIDTSDILGVRTVEDVVAKNGTVLGTKVGDRILSSDSDTVFPLRAALGYDLTQSLFVGEHCLLVEGSSDLLFLDWASRQLDREGRTARDPRWTVTPVGGISKLGAFVSLFGGNKLHIAVLSDFHTGDKAKLRDLRYSELLQENHVFFATDFAEQEEADIEDMIGMKLYSELVNRCYGLKGSKQLSASRTDTQRVIEHAKAHFRSTATEGPEFDHLSPAVYLLEHETDFRSAQGHEEAITRFEKFFQAVNQLLPHPPD